MSEAHGYSADEMVGALKAQEDSIDEQEKIREDFIATFTTPSGEKVFDHLYSWCRQNKSTYSQGQDVTHTAFLEGRRSVVLKIMEMLNLDDTTIIQRARNRALAHR